MRVVWIVPIVVMLTGCPAAPLPPANSPGSTTRGNVDPPRIAGQPLDRDQQTIEWTAWAESENKVGTSVWQKGTWNWQFAMTDHATGAELMRTGFDSTHVRIFGDIRLYMTIEVHHYLRVEQWVRVSSRLVDCQRKVVENWPEGRVLDFRDVGDPEGRTVLTAEISAVCTAAPFVDSRRIGQ